MEREAEIGERLRRLPTAGAACVRINPREYADDFFAFLNAALTQPETGGPVRTIYVSVTNPSALVWSIVQALDIPADRISFVDAISHTLMDFRNPLPNAVYIESPRMLETIMLRVEYLLRRHEAPRTILIFDSVNSLAIHNPKDLLNEFFHILVSNLKSRQVLTLLLLASDDPTGELDQMVGLIVDEVVDVVRPKE